MDSIRRVLLDQHESVAWGRSVFSSSAGLFLTAATHRFQWWLVGSLLLGLGTAMVYPSLIAAVSDASHPTWRARSLSV